MLINYAVIFIVFILSPAISNAGAIKTSESQPYTLAVSKTGEGTITSLPEGISCGDDCSEVFSKVKTVKLTAEPASGYTFKGWIGACRGSSPTCKIKMNSDKEVAATFVLPDLSAKWSGNKAKLSGSNYYVSGKLIASAGEGNAFNVKVKLYLSDDDLFDQTDTEIGLETFRAIKAGRSSSKSLKYKTKIKTLGKYLIAVIDPDNETMQTNADNNTVVSKRCIDRTISPPCGGCPPNVGEYCINLGYDSKDGNCIFPDGSECEGWSFWRNECGHEFSFCEMQGYTLQHINDNSNGTSYGVCIFKDGSECLENDYFTGQCVPSECKKWRMSQGGCVK